MTKRARILLNQLRLQERLAHNARVEAAALTREAEEREAEAMRLRREYITENTGYRYLQSA